MKQKKNESSSSGEGRIFILKMIHKFCMATRLKAQPKTAQVSLEHSKRGSLLAQCWRKTKRGKVLKGFIHTTIFINLVVLFGFPKKKKRHESNVD